ncbi:5-deoxy-glucuronate isomerase [Pedococcus sp. 5OH_020]|uniref:5-deoxy-glucuronate isomerase n=1 Tax=Pedococcus sp. 5OH_020 TaxID=2989814 RepID=UPI0022E9F7F7|nr:5-deoxy-glucuronate isomerase [Pedococcus sp. 5OH_020]
MTGADNARWVHPLGTAERDGWDVVVDDSVQGWQHTSLMVTSLAQGERRELPADGQEHVVVPLSGSVTVRADGHEVVLAGRASVFAGPTDVLYVARDTDWTLTAQHGAARVAVCGASATTRPAVPVVHLTREEVPVELRGAGLASRQVRNFGIPGVLEADSIIACEVVTPAGNWSSYPPHKHDEERTGVETELEEIYYFEAAATHGAPVGAEPFGYQRVYGTADRPIDVLAEVRSGDVVLVPHGWHGPAMAPPGYDLYYLNVMAGPGPERAWLICDDPAHGWVRQTWAGQDVDPRLRSEDPSPEES